MTAGEPSPELKFIGGALMAVGGLIAALCGTCTLIFAGASVMDSFRNPGDLLSILLLVGIVGGLPTLIGVLLFRWGRRLRRPTAPTRGGDLAVFSDDAGGKP
jgi:hypothetical protein